MTVPWICATPGCGNRNDWPHRRAGAHLCTDCATAEMRRWTLTPANPFVGSPTQEGHNDADPLCNCIYCR